MPRLNFLRKHASGDGAPGAPEAGRDDQSGLPIPGYDRISAKHLVAELSKHSQAELEAIETYERAHKDRTPVIQKLRYLRGPEPFQGYDSLATPEIVAALEGADTQKLQKTRLYERKFQGRRNVLEKITAGLHEQLPPSTHRDAPPSTAATS